MKLKINQEELKEALSMLVPCTTTDKLPIYSQLKFVTAKENRVTIYASDSEISMAIAVKADIESHGEFTLPGKEFFDLVKSFGKDKPITIELDDLRIKIKQGRSVYRLTGMGLEEFPEVKFFKSEAYIPLDPKVLLEAINTVSYARYEDLTRPALTGVYLEPAESGFFRAVGCDGRRLAICRMPGVLTTGVILNEKSVDVLSKILPKQEEVGLMVDGTQAYFCLDHGIFNARLIAFDYPNFKKVLPTGDCSLITINRADTIKAIKRLLNFAGDFRIIRLSLNSERLIFSAKDTIADSTEEIPLLEGTSLLSNIETAFNGTYLLHAIEKLKEESMTVRIYGPLLPLVISEKHVTKVIMPIKT